MFVYLGEWGEPKLNEQHPPTPLGRINNGFLATSKLQVKNHQILHLRGFILPNRYNILKYSSQSLNTFLGAIDPLKSNI